jgi:hypothetical protein
VESLSPAHFVEQGLKKSKKSSKTYNEINISKGRRMCLNLLLRREAATPKKRHEKNNHSLIMHYFIVNPPGQLQPGSDRNTCTTDRSAFAGYPARMQGHD